MKNSRWFISVLIGLGSVIGVLSLLSMQPPSAQAGSAPRPIGPAREGVFSAGESVSGTLSPRPDARVKPRRIEASDPAAPAVPESREAQAAPAAAPPHPPVDPLMDGQADQALLNLPLRFIANAGQTDEAVRFTVQGAGHTLFFTPDEIVFAANDRSADSGSADFQSASVVRLRFLAANPAPLIQGQSPLPGGVNYFKGSDPAQWQTNVPTYEAIEYRELYPGITLVYRGHEGRLKSEFVVAPGANPSAIRMAYSGAQSIRVRDDGALIITTPLGELIEERPVIYQEIGGVRREVSGGYVVLQDPTDLTGFQNLSGLVGFAVARYDPAQALVIDPVLVYSSFLGGSSNDAGNAVTWDAAGNLYVAGETLSTNFPVANAVRATAAGGSDAFVTQLIRSGGVYTYGFSSYLGSAGSDYAYGVAVDAAGAIYLTGRTNATSFPTTTNALQPAFRGGTDAFVTRIISASGAYTLSYSSYLGGSTTDIAYGIVADDAGNMAVTGYTYSTNWPTTTNALQPQHRSPGYPDAFVTRLAAGSGYTYTYSSYLGGAGYDYGRALAVDGAGNLYVTGETDSALFPVTPNALNTANRGIYDVFLTKFISTGGVYTYGLSTYIGGSLGDYGYGLAVNGEDSIYLTGGTNSTNWPTTTTALQAALSGPTDAFVAHVISASGAYTYAFSTYLGGNGTNDYGMGVAVQGNRLYVAGQTNSSNWPVYRAMQPRYGGGASDAFIVQITENAGTYALGYSTYLGGASDDLAYGVAANGAGEAAVVGSTYSTDWPLTPNALDKTQSSGDAFVAVVNEQAAMVGLSISKTVTPTLALLGQPVTFTLSYNNVGNVTATNVLITDLIPVTLTNISYAASDPSLVSIGSGPYTWQIASLAPSGSGVITVTGNVTTSFSAVGALITNTAAITSSTAEDLAFNNTASAAFKVASCWATPDGANVYGAVQDAVDAAPAGGTVKLAGLCNDLTTRGGTNQLAYVTKTLTLRGGYTFTNWTTSDPANNPATLDARKLGRALYINNAGSVLIENLNVISGTGSTGGGVYANVAALTVSNTTVWNNTSSGNGGGLYATGNVTLTNAQFFTNTANAIGGGACAVGNIVVSGGRIEGNRAGTYGGGLYVGNDLTGTQAVFVNNSATVNQGGGAYVAGRTTLTGGRWEGNRAAQWGGGLLANGASATLAGVEFYSNSITTNNGGGLYTNGVANLTNCRFENNRAPTGGGLSAFGALNVTNTAFVSNTATSATSGGGGFYANVAAKIVGSYFERNRGQYGGGYMTWSTLNVTNTTFVSNTAGASGGGGYANLAANITGGSFVSNTATYGGGVYISSTATLTGVQFISNTATYGGGLRATLGVTVINSSLLSNTAPYGGGAYLLAAGTVRDSILMGNASNSNGGGINAQAALTLTNSNLSRNASWSGGAVYVLGALNLSGGRFEDNKSWGSGGAVYAGGTANASLAITGAQFIANVAGGNGGAVYASSGNGRVVNVVMARNHADGVGDALYQRSYSTTQILHTTIASPTLAGGVAIYVARGTLGMTDTIIANHATGLEAAALIASIYEDYNLLSGNTADTRGAVASGGHRASANPLFVNPLIDDYHLSAGSGAIDTGFNVGINTDRDGNARPVNTYYDIGAYEAGVPGAPDLTIHKTVIRSTSAQSITYRLDYFNAGGAAATSVVIRDPVADHLTNAALEASSGAALTPLGGSPLAWQVADLVAPWSGGAITLTGQLSTSVTAGGLITNTAAITGTSDNYAPNNVSSVSIRVPDCAATPNGTNVYATAQEAVDAAPDGGTVKVAGYCSGIEPRGGTYQTAYLSKSITLLGGFARADWTIAYPLTQPTVLDPNQGGRALYTTQPITLSDLTARNGHAAQMGLSCPGVGCGGAIYAGSHVALNNVRVENSVSAASGGGLYAAGNAVLVDTSLSGNAADGVWLGSGGSEYAGGGGYVRGAAQLTGGRIENNQTEGNGGGLFVSGTVTLSGTQFVSNSAAYAGGGVHAMTAARITNGWFERNQSNGGGGGGGLRAGATTMADTIFIGNVALDPEQGGGGALINAGQTTQASTVTGGRFENNMTDHFGGGGGLSTMGHLNMTGTAFIANAARYGGGLYLTAWTGDPLRARWVNLLFARNYARSGEGDAIDIGNDSAGVIEILHTTIASPTLVSGNAVIADGGYVGVTNTIITNHEAGIYRETDTVREDYNLFHDVIVPTEDVASGGHSQTGDPRFADPSSDDYRLMGGSAAIDAGTNAGVATDFFGQSRPQGPGYDIGYDEFAAQVDLWVSKAVTPTTAAPAAAVTYTVRFGNAGVNPATGVVLTDSAPLDSLTNVTYTASGATLTPIGGAAYAWQVQDLAGEQGGVITLTGRIKTGVTSGTLFTNTAIITGAVVEEFTANNAASAGVTTAGYGATTTLASSPNPSTAGQSVTFTATVTSPQGTPTGNVTFYDNGVSLGVSALSGGAATFATSALAAGTHPVTAVYGGDASFDPSASGVLSQVVTALPMYTLSIFTAGAGSGTVLKSPDQISYTAGSAVVLTATADAGSTFVEWSGDAAGSINPVTVTMTANKTVTATFNLIPITYYTLTVTTTGTGSGTVVKSPDQISYTAGSVVILTATATAGSTFVEWSGDAGGAINPVTVTMTANRNVTATFNLSGGCDPIEGLSFTYTPIAPRVGQSVLFTATITAGTHPVTYTWSWSDATTNGTGATVSHVFPLVNTPATYTVTLTAANACPSSAQAQQAVLVQPHRLYLPLVRR